MTGLLPALFGALIAAGLLGAGLALRPHTMPPRVPREPSWLARRRSALAPRTRTALAVSVGVGLLLALLTGWIAAVVILPAAALGLPYLLSAPPAGIRRVEAMEEWTRSLAGVLGAGVGIEQALTATLRSTPEPIKAEVATLVARLRARWDTETALRAFADDLDDVTGDLVAANLINYVRHRRYLRLAQDHWIQIQPERVRFQAAGVVTELDLDDIAAVNVYRRRGAPRHIQIKRKDNRGIRLEGYGDMEGLVQALKAVSYTHLTLPTNREV